MPPCARADPAVEGGGATCVRDRSPPPPRSARRARGLPASVRQRRLRTSVLAAHPRDRPEARRGLAATRRTGARGARTRRPPREAAGRRRVAPARRRTGPHTLDRGQPPLSRPRGGERTWTLRPRLVPRRPLPQRRAAAPAATPVHALRAPRARRRR